MGRASMGVRVSADPVGDWRGLAEVLARGFADVTFAYRISPEPGFLEISESVVDLDGYTAEEHRTGHRMGLDLIDPTDLDQVRDAVSGAGGEPFELSLRVVHRDGSVVWTRNRWQRVQLASGEVVLVGATKDNTAVVEALASVTESERRYRWLAENSSDVVILSDQTMALRWVSGSALRTLGWRPEQLVGHPGGLFIHPEDLPRLRAAVAGSSGGEPVRVRYRWRRPDGSYLWVEGVGRAAIHVDGREVGRVVGLRDIDAEVRAQQDLAAREERYRILAENVTDLVYTAGPDRRVTWVSRSVTACLGWEPEELVGTVMADLVHPDDRARTQAERDRLYDRGVREPGWLLLRMRTKSGDYRWMSGNGAPTRTVGTGPAAIVAGLRDVDDLVRAREAAQQAEERYRMLAENSSDVVWLLASDGTVEWTSESAMQVLGWRPEQILGQPAIDLIHPEDRDAALTAPAPEFATVPQGQSRVLRADGSGRWMALRVRPVPVPAGTGRIVAMHDVHDAVTARLELEHATGHDWLTGLASRNVIRTRLDRHLGRLHPGQTLAVLRVGVDGLAVVNDALTHSAGDRVLETTAARLVAAVGDADLVGRGAGSAFIVVQPLIVSPDDPARLAGVLLAAARGVITVGGHTIEPTVSIGIATGGPGADREQLLRDASVALHQAKARGGDQVEFVDPSAALAAQRRMTMKTAIRDGLAAGSFIAHYQPIVALGSQSVVGYEALVRWAQPDGSLAAPADFLPFAEDNGQITAIDQEVLRQSLAVLAALPAPVHVAVNVAAQSLSDPSYAQNVVDQLDRAGIDPHRLRLEVTETALLQVSPQVQQNMTRLSELGVGWYVDDFGTGYSSISHLRDLPITGLKLDLSFSRGIAAGDHRSEQLAQALAALAGALDLDTVAEGVETPEQASILHAQGWVHGQGWLFGRATGL